jgi:mxaL protein
MKFDYQSRIYISAGLIVVATLMLLAALLWPKIEKQTEVMDLMFVLDITQSMNVEDVFVDEQSVDRLAWAKHYTKNTLQNLPCGTHAGLAVFSESRSLILINPIEVCENYHDLTEMLSRINGTMAWANSSEVSKAVFTAIKQSKRMESSPSIVFITDGHEAPPLNKTLYPKFKGEPGEVKGVFVGVGGDDLLPIPKKDEKGKEIGFWDVNEVLHQDVYVQSRGDMQKQLANSAKTEHMSSQKKPHLEELSKMVAFDYIASPESGTALVKALKKTANTREQTVQTDLSVLFGSIALLLMALAYIPWWQRVTR